MAHRKEKLADRWIDVERKKNHCTPSPVKPGIHRLLLRPQQTRLHNSLTLPPYYLDSNSQSPPKDKLHNHRPWPIATYPICITRNQSTAAHDRSTNTNAQ